MITLHAKLEDISQAAVADGSLAVELRGFGSQVPRVAGSGLIAETDPDPVDAGSDGVVQTTVVQNDRITPANTYYVVRVLNGNGDTIQINAYIFSGPDRAADLSTEPPIDPTNLQADPLIEDLTVYVNWSGGDILFDGTLGLVFYVYLTGVVRSVTFRNAVPGNQYTLVLQQDGVGGHAFPFPANMHGAPEDIGENPNATTTMIFSSRSDGSLDNTGLGVISRNA